jgi:hypothetical protein
MRENIAVNKEVIVASYLRINPNYSFESQIEATVESPPPFNVSRFTDCPHLVLNLNLCGPSPIFLVLDFIH